MKKLISIVIILGILSSLFITPAFALSDVENDKIGEAITKMTSLEILEGYTDGTFKPENNITRAEFVTIINRALGISKMVSGETANDVFIDVPSKYWAAGDIKYAVDSKLISGYGDGYFAPEDNITYEQAFKVIYCAMGYKTLAESKGEYPSNYIILAINDNICKNAKIKSFSDAATRGNISTILYEAMKVETLEETSIGSGENAFQKSGVTLLDKLLKLNKSDIIEGTVVENHLTALNDITTLEKGFVKVISLDKSEEWILKTGDTNASDLIGQRVEIYTDNDESSNYPIITSITPAKNKFLEIEAEKIINVTLNNNKFSIEYEIEEGINKTVSVISNVLYNGRAIKNPTSNDVFIKNGKIKLIENNNDSAYDVAILQTYYSYRVEKVSISTSTIFFKEGQLNGVNRINLDIDDDDFYYNIVNSKGEKVEISDIKENDIITVLSDKVGKNISIVVSTATVVGKASSYSEDEVTILDKLYKIAKDENGNQIVNIDLNKNGTYYLDTFSRIVSFEEGETLIENVGYIFAKKYNQYSENNLTLKVLAGGFSKREQVPNTLKYFHTTGNKEFKTFSIAEKARLDGVVTSAENLNIALVEGLLINFSVNKDGKIVSMETLKDDSPTKELAFNPEIGSFGGRFYIDEKTVIVCIPKESDAGEDDYFTKVTLDTSNKYKITGYEIDSKTKIAKFAVVTTSMKADIGGTITNDSNIVIAKDLFERVDEEGNVYCVIEGYQNSSEVVLKVKSEAAVYTQAKALKQGDVFYYSTNSQDLVDNIEKVDSLMPKPNYFHKDQKQSNERVFGKIHEIKRDELNETTNTERSEFVINIASGESENQNLIIISEESKNMPPVYLIDSKTGKISVITLDDLYSTGEVGYDDATEIFVCKKKSAVKGIVAVK